MRRELHRGAFYLGSICSHPCMHVSSELQKMRATDNLFSEANTLKRKNRIWTHGVTCLAKNTSVYSIHCIRIRMYMNMSYYLCLTNNFGKGHRFGRNKIKSKYMYTQQIPIKYIHIIFSSLQLLKTGGDMIWDLRGMVKHNSAIRGGW